MGRSNGYFYFVLYTQGSAVEEEADNYYTKKKKISKIKEGLVKEKKLGIRQIRTWQDIRKTNLKKKLQRSTGGKGEGLWEKDTKTLSFQDVFPSSVPSLSLGIRLVSPFSTNSLQKEEKRLHETEHHSSSPGLGGIFNEECN